jgi:methionyl-tRNA formyltransferase
MEPDRTLSNRDRPSLAQAKSRQALKAVFFTHLSVTTGPMVEAWLGGGNEIGAIVVYRQKKRRFLANPVRWLSLEKSLMRQLRRHRIPVIELTSPVAWDKLGATLSAGAPDIAISYGFMRLIPRKLLERFPHGGVNFHPALLPHYRGPQPLHWLAIHGAWDRFGGVTLHEMTDKFDEGDLLAQAPISFQAGGREISPRDFATSAVACMTRDIIPFYCAKKIRPWPQPPGDYPYAVHGFPDLVVGSHWTREYLRRLCLVMAKKPGVAVEISGRKIRLLGEAGVLGPPTGQPPMMRWRRIEFDLADHRVAYWRHSRLNRRLMHARDMLREFDMAIHEVAVRLGPFEALATGPSVALDFTAPAAAFRPIDQS